FLNAFNNRANEIKGLPDEVLNVVLNAPYLNGGLFRENYLDNLKVQISDKMLQRIIEFFESYNFTVKEDMPLESEVAVDPQMIGYVYESLANVAEEIYDRNDLGIFYTPRVEVDFMCRRSLVEYLSKNLSEIPKEKFYHLVFDLPEERDETEDWFTKENLWRELEDTLNNLSVVDPACGSGAFLVGMLNVVSDIYKMIYKHIGSSLTDFALKKRVVQYSLYGVDVMPWAIHAAELRLWLQLIVETDFKKEELRQHPLLPNLNLNLRVGDSLVQEIGGISFNLRTNNLKPYLKRRLEELKQEKRKYFENSSTAKFKTPEEVKEEEIRLFEDIIDERVESLTADIHVFENKIKMARSQKTLAREQLIDEKKVDENQLRIDANNEEIENLKSVKSHLNDPEKKPFVWDIDFAEIFAEKGGFDIVIGNPPYVNYKKISPPDKEKKTSQTTT
ncbi:MAG: DNA methyltransferase, partial [Candidatus Parvarchaeota archaeon]